MSESIIKITIAGNAAVGKTSTLRRYVLDVFTEERNSTIGASFVFKKIELNDQVIRLNLWDTAGQEKYYALVPMYYRNTNCLLLVYDITNKKSFMDVKDKWYKDLNKHLDLNSVVIGLIGNKSDMEDERQVTKKEALDFAKDKNLIFQEVSAKTNDNIDTFFSNIIEKTLEMFENNPELINTPFSIKNNSNQKSCCY